MRRALSRVTSRTIAALSLAVVALSAPGLAHHSYVTKYDSSKLTRLSGTIGTVSYTNPHIFFALDAGGTSWNVETESISVARANGLTEALLVTGAKAAITGWPSREKSAEIGLSTITFEGKATITMRRTAR